MSDEPHHACRSCIPSTVTVQEEALGHTLDHFPIMSRPGTPSLRGNKHDSSSLSRLAIPPSVKPTPSLSNLRVHSHNSTTVATIPPVAPSTSTDANLQSSASSVSNMDMSEGITMIKDVDEAEDEGVALGQVESHALDEDSKRNLREHLRKTLKQRPSHQGASLQAISAPTLMLSLLRRCFT
jgi:hypothetical protein